MNRFALLASFVLAGVMLGGCPETASCPEGQERVNRACVPRDGIDGGGADGGIVDGGPDGGPCGECGDATPFCVVDRDGGPQCSECDPGMGNASCSAFTDRPICDRDTARCVECSSNTDCTNPEASRCVDNECVPCEASSDCGHVVDGGDALPYCESVDGARQCVECTLATEDADCGAFVCDPETLRCSVDEQQETAGECGRCIADSQCTDGMRCVPMFYMGMQREQRYCLRPLSSPAGCTRPYLNVAEDRVSASRAPADDYCSPNETLTTCEAIIALQMSRDCGAGGDPTPCEGGGASECRMVGARPNACTYRCTAESQCLDLGAMPSCMSGFCR